VEPIRCFEALEVRALLSAPAAAVRSFAVTADTMTVVVSYASDNGIDASSIGWWDIGVTGPGASTFAESTRILSQQPSETVVQYLLRSGPQYQSHGAWANGTFNLGIPAGGVRSSTGEGIADTGAGSYWLWFPDTFVEVDRVSPIEAAPAGPWRTTTVPTQAGIGVQFRVWTREAATRTVPVSIRLTAPDGTERIQSGTIQSRDASGVPSVGTFVFHNPGDRPFDYTDQRGVYAAALGRYNGSQVIGYAPAAQTWLWFTGPKVEVLSTSVNDSSAQVTIRFTGEHGVDLSSLRYGVGVGIAMEETATSRQVLPQSATPWLEPQPDGSVIATYSFGFSWRPFTNAESGEWTYVVLAVDPFSPNGSGPRDSDGNQARPGILRRETHVFTAISPFAQRTAQADNPRQVLLSVIFDPWRIDLTTIGDGDVRLELNGQTYQLSLASVTWFSGAYVANYSLTLPVGQRLQTGTANFYLNAGAVTTSGLPNTESFLGSWWMWFN
jgi:hypothetical protein